jgi:hypothetical protein
MRPVERVPLLTSTPIDAKPNHFLNHSSVKIISKAQYNNTKAPILNQNAKTSEFVHHPKVKEIESKPAQKRPHETVRGQSGIFCDSNHIFPQVNEDEKVYLKDFASFYLFFLLL